MTNHEDMKTCFQALFAWQKLDQRKRELVLSDLARSIQAVGQLRDETRTRGLSALADEYQASLDAFECAAGLLSYSNDARAEPETAAQQETD